jgi:hypothetical protein
MEASASSVRQGCPQAPSGYVAKRSSDLAPLTAIRRVAAGERYVDPLGAKLVIPEAGLLTEPLPARDVMRLLALGLHEPGDRQDAVHLRAHGGYPPGAHHAQARSRIAGGARALRAC